MANQNTERDLKQELKNRPAVLYDAKVRQFDTSFWKELAVTVSAASNKVRLNGGGEIASYSQYLFGTYIFAVNVPNAPAGGHARKIGLLNPSAPTKGAIYFEITGTTFRCVSYDDDGTAQTSTVTWSGDGAEQEFKIEWERDFIVFSLAGTAIATHKTRVGKKIQLMYLINSVADNMDLGYISVPDTSILTS